MICKSPAGSYPYFKTLAGGEARLCLVEVFPLLVTLEKVTWPETAERRRQWYPQHEAAELVDEASLARIIEAWR